VEYLFVTVLIISGIAFNNTWLLLAGVVLILIVFFWRLYQFLQRRRSSVTVQILSLTRSPKNPILLPIREHDWESEAVFNPAALCINGRVHLLYRALGSDGISRIGYASSADGINFDERLPNPIFATEQHCAPIPLTPKKFRNPFTSPARVMYDREHNKSGGGWGGFEDPRAVVIEDNVHMTCSAFNGWSSVRMTLSSLPTSNFLAQLWSWSTPTYLSPDGGIHKNWVLFPEKIGGKYAILHSISPRIQIEYIDKLPQEGVDGLPIKSIYHPRAKDRQEHWDSWVRGAGPPPLRTNLGWLLFYHAIESSEPERYKLGVMLLDINDPTKILYRSARPILSPDMQYENDWKYGIIYVTGAIIKDGTLFIYYGGGDKTISVATAPLNDFLEELTHNDNLILTARTV